MPKGKIKKANPILDDESDEIVTGGEEQVKKTATKASKPAEPVETPAQPATPAVAQAPAKEPISLNKDIAKIKAKLASEQTVKIYIPKEANEPAGACEDVWINGYHVRVLKGSMQDVKQSVFDILDRKYRLTAQALNTKSIQSGYKPGLDEALN